MSTTVDTSHESMILTIDEAAAYLAIPKATLYTWRTRRVGFGPRAVKMGGCLRYRRADLDSWIVEHLEPAAGEQGHGQATAPPRHVGDHHHRDDPRRQLSSPDPVP